MAKQPFVCLDVLSALIEKPRTVNQLAACLDANPQTVRDGLKALATVGLAKPVGVAGHSGRGLFPYVWVAEVKRGEP